MKTFLSFKFGIILILSGNLAFAQNNYAVGVFYMPLWHNLGEVQYNNKNLTNHNWRMIDAWDEYVVNNYLDHKLVRTPLNINWPSPQWYDETMKSVTENQLKLMSDYSIDFVIYDSFFGWYTNGGYWIPYWNEVLENWKEPGFNNHGVEFAMMWAQDFADMIYGQKANPNGCSGVFDKNGGFDKMMEYWKPYLNDSRYKKIDNKPVFYIMYLVSLDTTNVSPEKMCDVCRHHSFFPTHDDNEKANDIRVKHLLSKIEEKVGKELYFVAVLPEMLTPERKTKWLNTHPKNAGFDATTAYTYKFYTELDRYNEKYDYSTMRSIYNQYYSYILSNSSLDYQIPITSGWHRGPFTKYFCEDDGVCEYNFNHEDVKKSQYKQFNYDNAISTPNSFEQALIDAKICVDKYPTKTRNTVAICCWNEYAEGTYIEPTYAWEYQYLERINKVFDDFDYGGGRKLINSDIQIAEISEMEDSFANDLQIYPNPAEDIFNISFSLESNEEIIIEIFDINGQSIQEIVRGSYEKGRYKVRWNIANLSNGTYLCSMKSGDFELTRKLIVDR